MRVQKLATVSIALIALVCIAQGGWIHMKAMVAQHLLQRAWSHSVISEESQKPWPWADVKTVARLSVPTQNANFVVLDGGSGEAMAFGPTRIEPNVSHGNNAIVIGGHRDTHLSFIRHLSKGDAVRIDLPNGETKSYVLTEFMIADSEKEHLIVDWQVDQLVLITCYPFDAITYGGAQRYIAIALPVNTGQGI